MVKEYVFSFSEVSSCFLFDSQARLDGLPTGDEIVTWPGLEDALKGVRGEFAAYRPESRTRSAMEVCD